MVADITYREDLYEIPKYTFKLNSYGHDFNELWEKRIIATSYKS